MNLHAFHEKVSKIALAFPGAFEKPCNGIAAFFVEKKMFARSREDGETPGVYKNDRDEWVAPDGDIFFFTDHYKNYPLLLIDLIAVLGEDLFA